MAGKRKLSIRRFLSQNFFFPPIQLAGVGYCLRVPSQPSSRCHKCDRFDLRSICANCRREKKRRMCIRRLSEDFESGDIKITHKENIFKAHIWHGARTTVSMQTSTPRLAHIPLQTLYDLLQPITLPKSSPQAKFTNWGQTYTCTPLAVFEPEDEKQCELILELARREGKTVRAVGIGHSPSDLACTSGFMLRTAKLDRLLEVSTIILSYLCLFVFCGSLFPSRLKSIQPIFTI